MTIPDEAAAPEHCDVFSLGGDFYLQVRSAPVTLDGLRTAAADGPVQLRDASTIKIGETLIFIQIGSAEFLDERNSRWTAEEPSNKKARIT